MVYIGIDASKVKNRWFLAIFLWAASVSWRISAKKLQSWISPDDHGKSSPIDPPLSCIDGTYVHNLRGYCARPTITAPARATRCEQKVVHFFCDERTSFGNLFSSSSLSGKLPRVVDATKVKLYSSIRVLSLSTDCSETWHKNVGKHLVRLNSRRPTSSKNKYTYLQFTKTLAEGKNRASFSERLNATVPTFEFVIDKTVHIGIRV